MRNPVDDFLNQITMYRLAIWLLAGLLLVATTLSAFNLLPFGPLDIALSTGVLLVSCWFANTICARFLQAPTNVESVYITALILALIISPMRGFHLADWIFSIAAAMLAMFAKYLLAYRNKHLFNPAAIGIAVVALTGVGSASWWVGTVWMTPFVLIAGLLLTRKIHRFDLVCSFLVTACIAVFATTPLARTDPLLAFERTFTHLPLVFFAMVMLTEPFTTPPTRGLRVAYGALTGILFAPAIHVGAVWSTPELALLVGNLFSFIVSPKGRHTLILKEKIPIARGQWDFVFTPRYPIAFRPGQFAEWSLPHAHPDNRGIRRYFTIASSPSEGDLRLGVKFYEPSSSFKKALGALEPGAAVTVTQLAGEFLLPADTQEKLVFIAGGIGITPFRSMICDLIDRNEKRDAVLLYGAGMAEDLAYRDLFRQAETVGIRPVYVLSKPAVGWKGESGMIDAALVARCVPDWRERRFYISGPHIMVNGALAALRGLGVSRNRIHTDYFPGFV